MKLPKVHGVIRRRLLVNYRLDPEVAQRQLPAAFRPKLRDGYAIAGIDLAMCSADDAVQAHVSASATTSLPPTSIFRPVHEGSTFFEGGSHRYSATSDGHKLDILRTNEWHGEPLQVDAVTSSYFADESRFPRGSVTFDCALIMRNIAHELESAAEMYA